MTSPRYHVLEWVGGTAAGCYALCIVCREEFRMFEQERQKLKRARIKAAMADLPAVAKGLGECPGAKS